MNRPLATDGNYAKTVVKASAYPAQVKIIIIINGDCSHVLFMIFAIINAVNQKYTKWVVYGFDYLYRLLLNRYYCVIFSFHWAIRALGYGVIIVVLALTVFPIVLYV